jgi:alpha-galactosidase
MEGIFVLTPEREKSWKKWIGLYNQKMLPTGDYLGALYDIGYDKPEAHAIRKADTLFYAFYGKNWNGEIELRGLENKSYQVTDYVNGIEYGNVSATDNHIQVQFDRSLLLQAVPVNPE